MYMVHVYMTTTNLGYRSKMIKPPKKESLPSGDAINDVTCDSTSDTVEPAPCSGKQVSFFAYCKHEPVILMHHLFIGGFGFLVIVYLRGGLGDCVFGFVYLMEVSTPFVSARGILSRMRLKSSRLYVVNGLLMLATFLVCRVLSLPYVCLLYSRAIRLPYLEAISSLPLGCKVSICILLLPQLYWFYLMSSGALKMLFRRTRPKQS
ncbi:unnamed protein product [Leptidea sinapis]|uniref:TLC domain-containing protein n=2 Tax=Leptidea sinapis TaxID=189913 RepID=A0A5E4Q150_9NEOP|nr:unnamed protein product [Leptidea sinapis]